MANVSVANTSASISEKTLLTAEGSQTVTGQKKFDLGASAPFAVASGAAKVTNLDADKLDGQEGTDYHDAAQLTGVLPVTVVGADPNADRIVFWDDSASAYAFLELVAGLASISGTQLTIPVTKSVCDGRLTLTSGTAVTTADVTAATTLYFTPSGRGSQIALINAAGAWVQREFSEFSIAVPNTADTNYDVFVYDNAGTATLELLAWTNATTRATAIVKNDGAWVKSGVATRRYVGTFRTTGVSGQTEDSFAKRFVWNLYNRVPREMRVLEGTNSWTQANATIRQANASAANQFAFVVGVAEVSLQADVYGLAITSGASPLQVSVGVGLDTTSAFTTGNIGMATYIDQTHRSQVSARFSAYPAVGYHFASWNESGGSTDTTTWYGDDGASLVQSGMTGSIDG